MLWHLLSLAFFSSFFLYSLLRFETIQSCREKRRGMDELWRRWKWNHYDMKGQRPSWWNEWKRKTKQWIFCSMKNIKWKRKQEARREGFYSCLLHKTHEAHSRYFKVKIRATASFGLLVAYMDSFLEFPFLVYIFFTMCYSSLTSLSLHICSHCSSHSTDTSLFFLSISFMNK